MSLWYLFVTLLLLHVNSANGCDLDVHIVDWQMSKKTELSKMSVPTPISNVPLQGNIVSHESVLTGAVGGATVQSGARARTMTEKGLIWQLETQKENFQSSISAWRRRAGRIERLLSEAVTTIELKQSRDEIENEMSQVTATYEKMDDLLSKKDKKGSAYEKYEQIEKNHHDLLKRVSQCIRELDGSGSRVSKGSKHSSKRSRSSHLSNSSSKRADAIAEAAVLQTKLKFIESESQHKLALERLQTMKQLEMAKAKADAILKVENESFFNLDDRAPDESQKYVSEYVESQINLKSDPAACLPMITGMNSIPANVSTTAPVSLPMVSASTSVSASISGRQTQTNVPLNSCSSLLAPPSHVGLNPNVNEFIPNLAPMQQTPHMNTQSTWMYPVQHTGLPPGLLGQQGTPNAIPSAMPYVSPFTNQVPPPHSGNRNDSGEMLNFAKSFAEQVNLNRLPLPEPTIFDGDPLKYPAWKCGFESLIDSRGIPSSERIYYLKKYLAGPAKDAIEGYFFLTSGDAYVEARKLLEERYGDPYVISNAFRDTLDSWPKMQGKDGVALRKFSDFLRQCETAMQTTGGLHILNDSRENRKMLSKLPDFLIGRWGRIVNDWIESNRGFPPFSEFRKFIVKEANIACNPFTSFQSIKSVNQNEPRGTRVKVNQGACSFSTEATGNPSPKKFGGVIKCIICKKPHNLDDCPQFLKKTLDERRSYIKENALCFGCLRFGHLSRFCRNRIVCKECSQGHPSSLHDETLIKKIADSKATMTEEKPQVESISGHISVSHLAGTKELRISSLIVPVWLSHHDNPDNERLVYALLDTQSDTTFVLESTCETLGTTGSNTRLWLSTMSAKNQRIDTKLYEGLMVRGFNDSVRIPLPATYSRDIIPANRSHIPTPQMATKWPHLEQISGELMTLSDCEIGLLIGYNCPKALLPRQVIAPENDGPYGQKTDLGWGIVGIVDPKQVPQSDCDPIGISHRILTYEVEHAPFDDENPMKGDSDTVQICFETQVREIPPVEIIKMLELDFSERGSNDTAFSQNDLKFVAKLKEGIHQRADGHYEMPLPFKASDPELDEQQCQPSSNILLYCPANIM